MPTRERYDAGTFCWVDLSAHDLEAAARWYGDLFGWELELSPAPGGPPYGMLKLGDDVVAGIGQLSDEMKQAGVPPTWNSYVSVDDAAAVQERVVELGGEVIFPANAVGPAGSLAFFKEPNGAVFAVWQPGEHCGATKCNEPNTFSWNELASDDPESSQKFYGDLFGWTFEKAPGPMDYTTISNNGNMNGGMLKKQADWGAMPPYWGVYFRVENIADAVQKVSDTGGRVMMPPREIPGTGTFAVVSDPQGGAFYLMQFASPG